MSALAAVQANGGNVLATARLLGLPYRTLKHWADGENIHPAIASLGKEKKSELADQFRGFAGKVLGLTTDADIRKAPLNQRFIAAGIACDKSLVLDGDPNSITENTTKYSHLSDEELASRIKAFFERVAEAKRQRELSEQRALIGPPVVIHNDPDSAVVENEQEWKALVEGVNREMGTEAES
jgi:hypothetical protein